MSGPAKLEQCLICALPWDVEWNDMRGEASCVRCGTPYQLLLDGPPVITALAADIPILREYWHETERHNGLGRFLGPPRYPENRAAFVEWLEERYPELAEKEPGDVEAKS